MSYDYSILKLRRPVSASKLARSDCEPLGDLETLRAVLDRHIPDMAWTPLKGLMLGSHSGETRIEFLIRTDENPVLIFSAGTSFRAQEHPPALLVSLCRAMGWALLDMQTVEYVGLDERPGA